MTDLVRRPAPRVYVSGPVTNPRHAVAVIRELERRGAHVALDWPAEMDRLEHVPPHGKAKSHPWAKWRMQALAAADAVLVLVGQPCETRDREHGAAALRWYGAEPIRLVTSGPSSSLGIWAGIGDHVTTDITAIRLLTRGLRSVPAVSEAAATLFSDIVTIKVYRRVESADHVAAETLISDVLELRMRPHDVVTGFCLDHVEALLRLVRNAAVGGSLGQEVATAGREHVDRVMGHLRDGAFFDHRDLEKG